MRAVSYKLLAISLALGIGACAPTQSVTTGPCRWEGGISGGPELKGSLICEAEVLGEVQRLLEMQCSGFSPFVKKFGQRAVSDQPPVASPAPESNHHVH